MVMRNVFENLATESEQQDLTDAFLQVMQGLAFLAHALEHVKGASGAWASTGPALRVSLNAAQPLGNINQVATVASLTSLANQVAEGGVPTNYNVYNTALENERALMARI